jgi:hypothetical protein
MKLPSLRELVEFERELFGVLLTSLGGGWRTVGCVPVNAAPQDGQLIEFSVTAAEHWGQVFIGRVVYRLTCNLHNIFPLDLEPLTRDSAGTLRRHVLLRRVVDREQATS